MADKPKFVTAVKSKLRNTVVTSVKFIEKYLFVGQSGDLHCFDLSKDDNNYQMKKIQTIEIFSFHSIHGIVLNNSKILVFGGKNIAFLKSSDYIDVFIDNIWSAEDWVLDGIWIENNSVILLTAHNVLLEYSVSSSELLKKICCVERCILYSGKILGSHWDDVIVFSGTVYQEVEIWAPKIVNNEGHSPVLHNLKGHQGVVFSISYDSELKLISSTSDDRTVRVWSVNFPDAGDSVEKWVNAVINLSFTAFGHTARVWRSAFSSSGHLVTVGEDSQILLWNRSGVLLNRWEHSGEIRCLDYLDDSIALGGNGVTVRSLSSLPSTSPLGLSSDYGTPKWVFLSSFGYKIIFTEKGFLILMSDEIIDKVYDERFVSYCVAAQSLCRCYIVLGGIEGDLILYEVQEKGFSKKLVTNINNERIYSLVWTSDESIVLSGDNGRITQICMTKNTDQPCIDKVGEHYLPPSKERWITCALLFDEFLICGDRMGSIHLYSAATNGDVPDDSLSKLHGTKGVTDMKNINGVIYSTGRDGTLKELTILRDEPSKLNLISTHKLPMDWATSIIESSIYGLIVAGFFDKKFLLWSVAEKITLLALECGGGHRSFDYMFKEPQGNIVISFIRMKCVNYLNYPLKKLVHQTIIAGYHTKPINCACLLSINNGSVSIVTGGEDNSLSMCKISDMNWSGCGSYIRHISAVRTIKCVDSVVVSAGARAQLIIWHLYTNSAGEWHLKEIKSHMIRDENDHRRSWRDAKPLVDPETRYMDLEVVKQDEDIFLIFAVCSDGMLRAFEYNRESGQFIEQDTIDCDQGCLLKVSTFSRSNILRIITGGTKGTVAFRKFPFDSSPAQKHKVHSSGINAMDHVWLKDRLVLATGGDDSCLVLSVFSLDKNRSTLEFNIVEHVHTCQVSGVTITSDFVISAALDQKLCLFKLSFDGNYLKTTFLCHFVSSIPDIHGILTWPREKRDMGILVYGCGFQLLHFNGSAIH